jgi:hypothetical protein
MNVLMKCYFAIILTSLGLTPWSRVLLVKLIVAQVVNFLAFYGTWRFIAVFIINLY